MEDFFTFLKNKEKKKEKFQQLQLEIVEYIPEEKPQKEEEKVITLDILFG